MIFFFYTNTYVFPKYNFFYINLKQYIPFSYLLFLQFVSLFNVIQKDNHFYKNLSFLNCNEVFNSKFDILKNSTLLILKFFIIALYTKKSNVLWYSFLNQHKFFHYSQLIWGYNLTNIYKKFINK